MNVLCKKNVIITNKIIFFEIENNLIPFLKNLDLTSKLKKIKVDDGAIKFILNGADIMKPGIIEYDKNIEENEIIAIINTKETIFAIGKAKCNFEDIEKIKKGKVIKTIHVNFGN
jgi:PUA domain protein